MYRLVEQRTCQTYLDRVGDDYSFDDTARLGLPSVVCEPVISTRGCYHKRNQSVSGRVKQKLARTGVGCGREIRQGRRGPKGRAECFVTSL